MFFVIILCQCIGIIKLFIQFRLICISNSLEINILHVHLIYKFITMYMLLYIVV